MCGNRAETRASIAQRLEGGRGREGYGRDPAISETSLTQPGWYSERVSFLGHVRLVVDEGCAGAILDFSGLTYIFYEYIVMDDNRTRRHCLSSQRKSGGI